MADNITDLERALGVIDNLSGAAFTGKLEAAFSASVGEHFRHIIEHYQAFLSGWPGAWGLRRRPAKRPAGDRHGKRPGRH